jgi:hypothetical protein
MDKPCILTQGITMGFWTASITQYFKGHNFLDMDPISEMIYFFRMPDAG